MGTIREFLSRHFRHFNAASVVAAARGWEEHLASGGKMLLTMGGAMSTAEIGTLLAELIRADKVHALCVTGANLEEDLFNLVAHDDYEHIPGYRNLSPADELQLRRRGMNRVTDTCIPEQEAMRRVEGKLIARIVETEAAGRARFPQQLLCELLVDGDFEEHYQIAPDDSWLLAAARRALPIFVPGWEDSTLGNTFVAAVMRGRIRSFGAVRSGFEQMALLADWYRGVSRSSSVGFFQIGGGISGDFPICVVPMINDDVRSDTVPLWGYFCQISEAATSYGSYSGASPNEKITWGKLDVDTPTFVVESDATIVFPLIAAWLLDR